MLGSLVNDKLSLLFIKLLILQRCLSSKRLKKISPTNFEKSTELKKVKLNTNFQLEPYLVVLQTLLNLNKLITEWDW